MNVWDGRAAMDRDSEVVTSDPSPGLHVDTIDMGEHVEDVLAALGAHDREPRRRPQEAHQ